jgi:hypothetical protein
VLVGLHPVAEIELDLAMLSLIQRIERPSRTGALADFGEPALPDVARPSLRPARWRASA